jgi:hypothetical protein
MHAFLLGLSLGLGAGLAPGPLLAVVIRTTLQAGFAAGARVACGPLISDLPIVLVAVLLATELPGAALGALGVAGGLFVLWLGVDPRRRRRGGRRCVPWCPSTCCSSGRRSSWPRASARAATAWSTAAATASRCAAPGC